jgi:hypothetical protein
VLTPNLSSDQNLFMDSEDLSGLDAANSIKQKTRKSLLSDVSDKFYSRYMSHLPEYSKT